MHNAECVINANATSGRMKKKRIRDPYGGVAQLGEHLPCKQGVRSSILLISTKGSKREARYTKSYMGL